MNGFNSLFMTVLIFLVAYAGVGILLDSKKKKPLRLRTRRDEASARIFRDFSQAIGHLAFNRAALSIRGFRERLERLLLSSGYAFGWNTEDLLFYKELALVLGAFFLWLGNVQAVVVWIIGLAGSFWLPDLALYAKGASRRAQLQRELPAYVDLLALTTESGLDLLMATERIMEKMPKESLRQELQSMVQESQLGTPRKEVLLRWSRRMGLSDAQSLASLVIQSDEMGTPLAGVLRSYAEDMRNRRILRAEEIAGKIPVKILFPMLLFFFPIIFAIILGPIAMQALGQAK